MISEIRIVRGAGEGQCLLQFQENGQAVFEISFQYQPLLPGDILRFKGLLNYRGAGKTYTEKLLLAPGVALIAEGRNLALTMSGEKGGEFRLVLPEKLFAVVDTLLDEVLAL